jgi:hypothetical protein
VRLRVTKQLDTDIERVAKAKLKAILESENPAAFELVLPRPSSKRRSA